MVRFEVDSSVLRDATKSGGPVEIVDTTTGQSFVLVPSEQYQKMCVTMSGDFDPRLVYPFVDQAMADDDAHDSLLDTYQT